MNGYFIVDWVLPCTELMDLRTAQRALEESARRLTEDGHPVRCVHSTFVPTQGRWMCLFAADSEAAVRKVHEVAQLPVPPIAPALDLSPHDVVAC